MVIKHLNVDDSSIQSKLSIILRVFHYSNSHFSPVTGLEENNNFVNEAKNVIL